MGGSTWGGIARALARKRRESEAKQQAADRAAAGVEYRNRLGWGDYRQETKPGWVTGDEAERNYRIQNRGWGSYAQEIRGEPVDAKERQARRALARYYGFSPVGRAYR